MCVATDVLALVGLSSFRAGCVALVGLACYDALAVFASGAFTSDGQSVMLAVASSDVLAGPTRLLFPQDAAALAAKAAAAAAASPLALPLEPASSTSSLPPGFGFSLLGLGDVVVPGTLIAAALRFDGSRAVDLRPRAEAAAAAIDEVMAGSRAAVAAGTGCASDREIGEAAADAASAAYDRAADGETAVAPSRPSAPPPVTDAVLAGPRTYFTAALVSYAAGLGLAFFANAVTHAGQPALVYIVPAMLGGLGAQALARNEVERVWKWTDGAEVEK